MRIQLSGTNNTLDPSNWVVFRSPSWFFSPVVKEFNLHKELNDSTWEEFDQESRGNFQQASGGFLKEDWINRAILGNRPGTDTIPPENGYVYKAAMDPSDTIGGDCYTFTIWGYCQEVKDNRDKVKQFVAKAWKGKKDKPIKRAAIAEYVAQVQKIYNFDVVYSDQREFQSIQEIFFNHGLRVEKRNFTSGTNPYKVRMYHSFRAVLRDGTVNMLNLPAQNKEAKELIYETSATGRVRIRHPKGGHDDYMDADAMTVHELIGAGSNLNTSILKNELGTTDFGQGDFKSSPKCKVTGKGFGAPAPAEYMTISSKQDGNQKVLDGYTGGTDFLAGKINRFYVSVPAVNMRYNLKDGLEYLEFKEDFPEVEALYSLGKLEKEKDVNKAMDYAFNYKFDTYLKENHPDMNFSDFLNTDDLDDKFESDNTFF